MDYQPRQLTVSAVWRPPDGEGGLDRVVLANWGGFWDRISAPHFFRRAIAEDHHGGLLGMVVSRWPFREYRRFSTRKPVAIR